MNKRDLTTTQAEAARRAGITPPRMNDVVKGRTEKFTLDALVKVASSLAYSVQFKLKKVAQVEWRRHFSSWAERVG